MCQREPTKITPGALHSACSARSCSKATTIPRHTKLLQFLLIPVLRVKVNSIFFFSFESSNGKKSYQIWKQGQKAMDKWSRASKEMTGDLIMGLKVWHEGGINLTGTCVSLCFFREHEKLFPLLASAF